MPRKIPFGSASLERQCFLSSFVMASWLNIWEIFQASISVCHGKVNTQKTHTKNDVNLLGMVFHLSSGFVFIDTV